MARRKPGRGKFCTARKIGAVITDIARRGFRLHPIFTGEQLLVAIFAFDRTHKQQSPGFPFVQTDTPSLLIPDA